MTVSTAPTNRCFPNKKSLKEQINLLLWFLGYLFFLFLGGICIAIIERGNDHELKNERRLALLAVLKKYNISSNDTMILDIIKEALNADDVGGLHLSNLETEVPSSWTWGTGLFFCSTIITTIGYGNMFPRTIGGQWFVIMYTLFGVPLTGIILGKFGIRLTELIKRMDSTLTKPISKILGKLPVENSVKYYIRMIQIVIVFFLFILLFWFLPAAIISEMEDWDIMTSIYFCFITMTTIGLGDVVPQITSSRIEEGLDATSLGRTVAYMFYFILGLSALTIIFTLTKSLFDSIAITVQDTAGTITGKGMMLAGSIRHKLQIGNEGDSDSKENAKQPCNTTEVDDVSTLEIIAEEPEKESQSNNDPFSFKNILKESADDTDQPPLLFQVEEESDTKINNNNDHKAMTGNNQTNKSSMPNIESSD